MMLEQQNQSAFKKKRQSYDFPIQKISQAPQKQSKATTSLDKNEDNWVIPEVLPEMEYDYTDAFINNPQVIDKLRESMCEPEDAVISKDLPVFTTYGCVIHPDGNKFDMCIAVTPEGLAILDTKLREKRKIYFEYISAITFCL